MGPIWGRHHPGGPHVGPMNFAIWELNAILNMIWMAAKTAKMLTRIGIETHYIALKTRYDFFPRENVDNN